MKNPSPKKHAAKPAAPKHPSAAAAPVHVHAKPADRHLRPGHLGIFNPEPVRATAGETFDLALRSNGRVDTWSAKGLPDGLVINEKNGNISGTPALPGPHKVCIQAIAKDIESTLEFIIDVD